MKGFFTKSRKLMVFALAFVMCAATAFSVAKTNIIKAAEDAGDTPAAATVSVKFDTTSERLTVNLGDKGYLFYTTDKVTKKVPAPNKWQRTQAGGVDCSTLAKAKTLYFAMSTTPALEEVVAVTIPAKQKISKATYDAVKKEWKVTSGSTDVTTLAKCSTPSEIASIQLTGGKASVQIPALKAANTPVGDEDEPRLTLAQKDGKGAYLFPDGAQRKSDVKEVKIAKRAAGPAVTIDYANHVIKYSKAVEAATTENIATVATFGATDTTSKEVGKGKGVYFGDEAVIYNFRTAATEKKIESLETVVSMPATPEFTGEATIVGGFEQDAYLEIKAPHTVINEKKTTVAYQYAVVDGDTYAKIVNDGKLLYEDAAKAIADKKLVWKTIKATCDPTDEKKDTTATAKIVNSKTAKKDSTLKEGTVVIVRAAATANVASSKITVFAMPTKTNSYWTNGEAKGLSVKDAVVNGSDKVEFVVVNGNGKVTADSVKDLITLNKAAATVTVADVADDAKVTITVPDTLKKDSVDLTVVAKKGFITGSTYAYTSKIAKADLKAPELVTNTPTAKWTVASDKKSATVKLTVQVSEDLAKLVEKEYTVLSGDVKTSFETKSTNYTLTKATYTAKTAKAKAKIEFELTYDLTAAAAADGAIALADDVELFDTVGHAFTIKDGNISVKADSAAKKYEPETTAKEESSEP